MRRKLPILGEVGDLQGIEVHFHDSVFRDPVAVGCEAGGHQVVVRERRIRHVLPVGELGEEGHMVGVGVAVELASDQVGIAINQSVEPNGPVIQVVVGRDVPDQIHELLVLL